MLSSRPLTVSLAQNVRMALRCRIRISLPNAQSDCTLKLAPSHASPATGPLTGQQLPRRVVAMLSE